jgi:pimeloyl-ACP methyl ester carboxylesterase
VNSLQGIDEIHLVAHSMGGLVVRAMLREGTDVRIRRMVMLGVPNHGARLASLLQENVIYRTVYGPAGQQLAEDPRGLIAELPVPGFEFAVIAGARGAAKPSSAAPPSGGDVEPTSERERPKIPAPAPGSGNTTTTSFADGFNPLIPGDDDGTVSVESTKLPGAADFLTVRVWHSFLMSDLTVIEATVRFLQSGALRATGLKHPLPREPMATPRPDDRAPAT